MACKSYFQACVPAGPKLAQGYYGYVYYVCIYLCIYLFIYIHMYIYIYTRMCVYIYIYSSVYLFILCNLHTYIIYIYIYMCDYMCITCRGLMALHNSASLLECFGRGFAVGSKLHSIALQ